MTSVVVYPHDLGMGGSQLNAVEIAGGMRDLGHQVIVYGRPGVLCDRITELGLEFVASPEPKKRPSPRVIQDLRRLIRERHIDVVHGYEWPPTLEARLAVMGTRAVCVSTVMSMAVAPFIPRRVPLVVGTEQIAAVERAAGRRSVSVIEPPVDVVHNAPGRSDVDVLAFRAEHRIPTGGAHVVCVSRLAHELKLEGILTAIDVVPTLGADVTLTIVGDGPAGTVVHAAAASVNERVGRGAVRVIGQVADPRPAYDGADIVLGMGGSALRALAFAKPLVVQGERGYWRLLTDNALEEFLWTGWYGVGESADAGPDRLRGILTGLLSDSAERKRLGAYGRDLVCRRFSVEAAVARQQRVFEAAVLDGGRLRAASIIDDGRAAIGFAGHVVRRKASRLRGTAPTDDFNAAPIAGRREWERTR